jgi:hypothetical protein
LTEGWDSHVQRRPKHGGGKPQLLLHRLSLLS